MILRNMLIVNLFTIVFILSGQLGAAADSGWGDDEDRDLAAAIQASLQGSSPHAAALSELTHGRVEHSLMDLAAACGETASGEENARALELLIQGLEDPHTSIEEMDAALGNAQDSEAFFAISQAMDERRMGEYPDYAVGPNPSWMDEIDWAGVCAGIEAGIAKKAASNEEDKKLVLVESLVPKARDSVLILLVKNVIGPQVRQHSAKIVQIKEYARTSATLKEIEDTLDFLETKVPLLTMPAIALKTKLKSVLRKKYQEEGSSKSRRDFEQEFELSPPHFVQEQTQFSFGVLPGDTAPLLTRTTGL